MGSNIIELAKLGHERAAELKASCGAVDARSLAQLISDLATQLEVQYVRAEESQREFRSADITMQNLEAKCEKLAAERDALVGEITRRDEIFIPVYPDNELMTRMMDVLHDSAKIHCDEDGIFISNPELVITALLNHYIQSGEELAGDYSPLSAAITDIISERKRQQSVEGWTPEHDDQHVNFEMAIAGGLYAISAVDSHPKLRNSAPSAWPWNKTWWKQAGPRRDLVKAGALIAAEIERIDRADGKGEAA